MKNCQTVMSGTEVPVPDHGFTLIELSIVLVIIGLIVGGILVGQDLIKASEVRSTIGQIEKYNSSVNTFRTKYGGIPGDLPAANASAFGLTTRAGSAGRGDGNGLVDSTGGTNSSEVFGQEVGMFWNDLSQANLVDGQFSGVTNEDSAAPLAVITADVPLTFPPARLARGNYITVGNNAGINYYLVMGITSATVASGEYTASANLTPTEAYNMDNKLDDGQPNTGVVQAKGTPASTANFFTDPSSWAATSAVGNCMTSGTSATDTVDTYNRTLTLGGDSPACMIRFRFN
jgi:prepilin-type N-terminal cleavage/methylation domain-containing protein